MIKKITMVMLVVLISISTIACRSNGDNQKTTFQKDILRIEQFKDELPNNYFIMDIKERALKYDEMVFDFNISGTFFPLIWQDETFNTFGRSEEHTSELQSRPHLVCRLLLEKKK